MPTYADSDDEMSSGSEDYMSDENTYKESRRMEEDDNASTANPVVDMTEESDEEEVEVVELTHKEQKEKVS